MDNPTIIYGMFESVLGHERQDLLYNLSSRIEPFFGVYTFWARAHPVQMILVKLVSNWSKQLFVPLLMFLVYLPALLCNRCCKLKYSDPV